MRITNNVFLDSSALIGQSLDFSSPALVALEKLAREGEANILTTSIVIREVESKIRERIREAEVALDKVKARHPVLKNLTEQPMRDALWSFSLEKACIEVIGRYSDYRARTHTTEIPIESASMSEVFDSYFSRRPPFGEGGKKSEFPDAVNISAVEDWCRKKQEKAYVISSDSDIVRACSESEWLELLSGPAEYTDLFYRESAVLERVEESTYENAEELGKVIGDAFVECGFYLDDEDGDVYDVEVQRVAIDDLALLRAEGSAAEFEVSGTIEFAATISYVDPESGVWDSEDGVKIGMERVRPTVVRSTDFTLSAEVSLNDEGLFQAVKQVRFPGGNFGISAIENDWQYN